MLKTSLEMFKDGSVSDVAKCFFLKPTNKKLEILLTIIDNILL